MLSLFMHLVKTSACLEVTAVVDSVVYLLEGYEIVNSVVIKSLV